MLADPAPDDPMVPDLARLYKRGTPMLPESCVYIHDRVCVEVCVCVCVSACVLVCVVCGVCSLTTDAQTPSRTTGWRRRARGATPSTDTARRNWPHSTRASDTLASRRFPDRIWLIGLCVYIVL